MLTPSTRATIRPRTLPFSAMPFTQTRTIFGWKPRLASYDSHLDPLYPRFIRHRTLKTRAKLLKTIRRRQQFEWNAEVKPIVGPKHVRYASHWDGTNRPKWVRYSENEEKQGREETNADTYELSDKERAWKKQMEAMRKRIEADPYEAVFGKRFEPFWSPLFPRGMKDEVGSSGKEPEKSAGPVDGNDRRERTTPVSPSTWKPETAANTTGERDKTRQTEPYTYSSYTSWDSQSNKTKKSEWNSISRKTTNYEYDPVSNRMVPIPSSPPATSQQEPANVPAHVTWKPIVAKPRSSTNLTTANVDKVDAKVGELEHTEAAMVGQKAGHSTDGNVQSPKPQLNELDTLTAVDVRASMGKPRRHERAEEAVPDDWVSEQQALKQQIRDWDNSVTKLKSQVSAIVDEVSATQLGAYLPTTLDRRAQAPKPVEPVKPLQSAVQRMQSKAESEPFDLDDAAAHESTEPIVKPVSVPKDWDEQADILQSDRVMRTRGPQSPTMRWFEDMDARRAAYKKQKAVAAAEQSALVSDKTAELEKANAILQAEVASQRLAMSEQQDRSAHKIRSLRGELETAYKQSSIHADAFRDHIAGLDKELTAAKFNANEVQVKAIKERYSRKVAGLQKELERAYVQSSVHADEFTKRIKELESELVRLTKAAGDASNAKPVSKESKLKDMQGEGDFCPNVTKFADSEMWYKQPSSSPQSSNVESFKAEQKARDKARDKALVPEVKSIYESAYGAIDTDHRQPFDAQDAALESALARYNKQAKYAFKNDGLEEELAGNVISAAGDTITREKLAYTYRKDNLEAELAQRVKVEAQKKPDGEYAYKCDRFEPTSQDQNKPSTTEEPRFVQDDLEAELVQQGKSAEVYEPGQKFVPDNLEAELKGEAAPSSVPSEKFRPDDLEMELQKHSKSADAGETSQRFVPDNLEAELKGAAAPSSAQSGKPRPDDLELELRKQSKSADVCEPSQRFVPDTLGAELKDQSETAAASQHSEAFKPDGLEAELVKKFNYADAKLDNLEAELKGGLEAATSSQQSEKFKPDELEVELQKRDKAPVATQRSERFIPGALEAELKRLAIEKPAYASDEYAAEAAKPSRISKMELAMAESLGSELDMPLESATSASAAAPSVQSQQSPLYKVIEYDLECDSFSTTTTSSWGTTAPETSISRSQALAQLDTARRWIQHFPFLKTDTCMLPKQWRGYQIVDARGNVLVMRKSQHAQKVAEPLKTSAIAAKQPETQSAVNPIDGTRSSKDVHAATGDYASPTGYVNLDLAEDLAAKSKAKDVSTSAVATDGKDSGISTKGSRIIKRQEPVFSGARRDRKADRRAKRVAKRESRRLPQQLEPYRGPGWGIFVFSMTLTTGFFMYLVGYLAERGSTGRGELELKAAEAKQAEASKTEKADAGKWRLDDAMWQRK